MSQREKNYGDMTPEELERELREAFLCTDRIDGPLNEELEKLREALDRKRPVEYLYTPEESWEHFLADNREELAPFLFPGEESEGAPLPERTGPRRARSLPAPVRRVLIAAAMAALLGGAALAADSLDLRAWIPRWNAAAERYEPAAQESSGESPIPAALAELGIREPVYPSRLPEGFLLTESHISENPLVLVEQYARGDQRLSITVTPTDGFKTAVYQRGGEPVREYRSGKAVHYVFFTDGTITSIRYTQNYATTVSGDLPLEEMKGIMDSVREGSA